MTIEERADKYMSGNFKAPRGSYIQGATEQREIDIEKACSWFMNKFEDYENKSFLNSVIEELKKAMEE